MPLIERAIAPGIRLMQMLRLPVKFAIISTAFMVPLGVAMLGVLGYAASSVEFAEDERLGTAFVAPLNELTLAIARRRDGQDLDAAGRGYSRALDAVEALNADQSDALRIGDAISDLRASWRYAGDPDAAVAATLVLFSRISDNSKLTLDPDVDSHYAMAIVMDYAPKLAETAARLDALARQVEGGVPLSAEHDAALQVLLARAALYHDSWTVAVRRAVHANPSLSRPLSTADLDYGYAQFLAAAQALRVGSYSAGSGNALSIATMKTSTFTASALDDLLVMRIGGFEAHRNRLPVVTLAGLMLAVFLITSFYLSNLRGFEALSIRMRKQAQGDLTANFPARGRDEIGQLIDS
jgi:HAMP domain